MAGSGAKQQEGTPQGQLVLNAPRVGADDVAITASAPFTVTGAASIALYGWRTYLAEDGNGTVAQGYADHTHTPGAQILSLNAIDGDSQAFITAADGNTALLGRLAGLASYGAGFHLRPGVEIDSTKASGGNITISGDVDLSGYRYSDPTTASGAPVFGSIVDPAVYGSGEAGAILFRAKNDLIVNGSVTDGFAPPPDKKPANYLPADNGWYVLAPSINNIGQTYDALSADVILPSSLVASSSKGGVTTTYHHIQLLAGTTFDEARAISLNYAITIASANIAPNEVIPFSATTAADLNGNGIIIPQGGFVTTALIIEPDRPRVCRRQLPAWRHDHPAGQRVQRRQRLSQRRAGGAEHRGAGGHAAVDLRRRGKRPERHRTDTVQADRHAAGERVDPVQHRCAVRAAERHAGVPPGAARV